MISDHVLDAKDDGCIDRGISTQNLALHNVALFERLQPHAVGNDLTPWAMDGDIRVILTANPEYTHTALTPDPRFSEDEKLILMYKLQTAITDPTMRDVAEWAELHNYRMPKAKIARELLAKRLSRSARQKMREDAETGFFGRANPAYQVVESGEAKVRWFAPKSPTATREKFAKARTLRCEQMVGDGFQYALDDLLWNRDHPNDPQFVLDLNITEDVMWRMNGIAAEKKAMRSSSPHGARATLHASKRQSEAELAQTRVSLSPRLPQHDAKLWREGVSCVSMAQAGSPSFRLAISRRLP